jgi:hypothetical protein
VNAAAPGVSARSIRDRRRSASTASSPSARARAAGGEQRGQGHGLALQRQHSQHLLLGRRIALELLREQPPNAREDAADAGLLQEGTDLPLEELADGLAD